MGHRQSHCWWCCYTQALLLTMICSLAETQQRPDIYHQVNMANSGWGIAQVHSTVAFEMHDSTVINLQAVLLWATNLSFRLMNKAFCSQQLLARGCPGFMRKKPTKNSISFGENVIYIMWDIVEWIKGVLSLPSLFIHKQWLSFNASRWDLGEIQLEFSGTSGLIWQSWKLIHLPSGGLE